MATRTHARTLISDTHTEPLAHILNFSTQSHTLKASGFLSTAEPVNVFLTLI